ncbi:MAG TPA: hypothetical protein VNJ11_10255 [Bryobacteraceae bacterium]|nr:hypothetical protein [Bryobacteraceae bacterium]
MADHRVRITVSGQTFRYDQPIVRAQRGDSVIWASTMPFAVDFGRVSPSHRLRESSKKGRVTMKVRANAPPGRYKYFVAVFDGSCVLTDDPEIIIE